MGVIHMCPHECDVALPVLIEAEFTNRLITQKRSRYMK